MKQDAANHWKVQALGRSLAKRIGEMSLGGSGLTPELGRRLAMGVVESLWIWAKRYYPRGDIGRASDEQIAIECGWDEKDAPFLIAEFCRLRILDVHKDHRLIVHDLSEHAEDYVRKAMERAGIKRFADGKPVRRPEVGRPKKETRPKLAGNSPESRQRLPEIPPALPNPTQPNPTPSSPIPSCPTQPQAETPAAPEPLRIHSPQDGSGGGRAGNTWTPASLTMALVSAGMNNATAKRFGIYASKFDGFDVVGEYGRLRNTPSVASPTGALVKLMAQHAGIEMDQQKLASGLQAAVNQRRAERA